MLRENEFIRNTDSDLTLRERYKARERYRNMSNLEKKRMVSHLTKFKQGLSFDQWWSYIGHRIKEGKQIHRRNKNNIRVDPMGQREKERVESEEFREYHKLK